MVTPFAPLRLIDGYLPIEDHGLIGDGTTAALIGRDGAVSWLCVPRFDSPPLFCRLVDAKRGGAFSVTPEELVEARQFYEPDSGVLVTELRSRSGLIPLTDALTLRSGANLAEDVAAGRAELLHSVSVLQGRVRLRIEVEPQGGARAERHAGGFQIRRTADPERDLWLFSTNPTTAAIRERLGAGHGLLYRYLPDESPDGLPGHEGAFLLCSFWLVDNLAKQGRLDEAHELSDALCARANPTGLLPEQIDPSSGAFLGNYPQAFSHVGLIASRINLARLTRKSATEAQ